MINHTIHDKSYWSSHHQSSPLAIIKKEYKELITFFYYSDEDILEGRIS
ncbi:hypothetical protein HanPSC8_Chr14g0615081 [Helianthus annuus]|nr:hypothetical protein HanPSC8_Chr14g0615081 [Helianthus annuus]